MLIKDIDIVTVCDTDASVLKNIKMMHPHIETCQDFQSITRSPDIDAVVIATPVQTHYQLASDALNNGKHIFITKPFTASSKQAEKLIRLAKKKKLTIMVDHTFLFTGAVKKIKELIDSKVLGDLLYFDSTRINLGRLQHDVNVIWDLAPHDFSILDYLINNKPTAISAHGTAHYNKSLEDIAYITIYYKHDLIAHLHVNWLSPVKVRTTLIGGSKKMIVWDDLSTEKIKIYDKGVKIKTRIDVYKLLFDYRSGDVISPHIDLKEALLTELEYFVECVLNKTTPINDGQSGLNVVNLLEAANKSLAQKGKLIKLNP